MATWYGRGTNVVAGLLLKCLEISRLKMTRHLASCPTVKIHDVLYQYNNIFRARTLLNGVGCMTLYTLPLCFGISIRSHSSNILCYIHNSEDCHIVKKKKEWNSSINGKLLWNCWNVFDFGYWIWTIFLKILAVWNCSSWITTYKANRIWYFQA